MSNRNRVVCPKYHQVVSKNSVKSSVWKYFGFPGDENGRIITELVAICETCRSPVSSKATSNLWSHLRCHHPLQYHTLNSRTTSTPSLTSSPQHLPEIKDTLEVAFSPESDDSGILTPDTPVDNFTANLSMADVQSWLTLKNFSKYLPSFELYSAKDLLSLSREDIIEICGPSDGIRLYNCLHQREPPPVRRLYVSRDNLTFHALYLQSVICTELQAELCKIFHFSSDAVSEMYITGPNGILLVLTDRVLQNIKDESTFTCEILKAEENGRNTVILRAYIPNQET